MGVSRQACYIATFLKYRDHYNSKIIVAASMQRCNYLDTWIIIINMQTLVQTQYIQPCVANLQQITCRRMHVRDIHGQRIYMHSYVHVRIYTLNNVLNNRRYSPTEGTTCFGSTCLQALHTLSARSLLSDAIKLRTSRSYVASFPYICFHSWRFPSSSTSVLPSQSKTSTTPDSGSGFKFICGASVRRTSSLHIVRSWSAVRP